MIQTFSIQKKTIRNQAWPTVSRNLEKTVIVQQRPYPDLQDYIIRNQMGEDATVEELVEENKQYHEEYKN